MSYRKIKITMNELERFVLAYKAALKLPYVSSRTTLFNAIAKMLNMSKSAAYYRALTLKKLGIDMPIKVQFRRQLEKHDAPLYDVEKLKNMIKDIQHG